MPIVFHEESKEFHLYNEEVSYVIRILENKQLENLYYGKRIHDRESFAYLHEEAMRPLMAVNAPEPSMLSLQYTRQEYPSYGTSDFRLPAYTILQENGSRISDFGYASHEIFQGKKKIEPLPAVYVEDEAEAVTLEIRLWDALMETELVLSYTLFEKLPVITRHVCFRQMGSQKIVLENVMSMSVDLPDSDFEMVQLSGAWGRERYVKVRRLEQGVQSVYSLRGASSSEHNPFLALKRRETTERSGEVYGFSFVYSGNFLAQAEVCTDDATRVMMGIHPNMFRWQLSQGETFQAPEAVMVYADRGLNQMSQTFHELYRTRLVRGVWRDRPRPVLLNNWEATEMKFNEEGILKIAAKGKEAGVELFVLDDGWFGERNHERAGLGDWSVNLEKLPDGITGLSEKIEAMGMKFGLWIEPEMVNKDSDLFRSHPDWILSAPGRFQSHGRFQYVLDFSRSEVVDEIHRMISKVIREAKISYIKWDMNRYITECYSQTAESARQGEVMHRYILGVYDLYTRLREEFPEILFESCSSGGARFDPGMLYFAPQTWTSDDTDAAERMKIQYGTSFVYPVSSMGAHVSAVPNQQMGRTTPIATRANVAFFGAFGYELDLNALTQEEMDQVKKQIAFMKEQRELIQFGKFYRLLSPFEGSAAAWMVVSEDQSKALAGYYQRNHKINTAAVRLKLQGLDADRRYEVVIDGKKSGHYGDELMYAGLVLSRSLLLEKGGDFASLLISLS